MHRTSSRHVSQFISYLDGQVDLISSSCLFTCLCHREAQLILRYARKCTYQKVNLYYFVIMYMYNLSHTQFLTTALPYFTLGSGITLGTLIPCFTLLVLCTCASTFVWARPFLSSIRMLVKDSTLPLLEG